MKEYYVYDADNGSIKPQTGIRGMLARIDKWQLLKHGVSMVASGCATAVMHKYLRSNMPETDSMFDKAVMGVGTYFITGIVGSQVAEYCDKELESWKTTMLNQGGEEDDAGRN